MGSLFNDVSVEKDTKLIAQTEAKFGELDVLYQKWLWDGIVGESLIYLESQVADKNDQQLEALVRESPMVAESASVTVKRNCSGYAFVNYFSVTQSD